MRNRAFILENDVGKLLVVEKIASLTKMSMTIGKIEAVK
jgi:hypothetical protein